MEQNETNNDENIEKNEDLEENLDDNQQDNDDSQEEVSISKEELERLKEAEKQVEIEREKSTRYRAERDRFKGKTKEVKQDESLIEKAFLNSSGYKDQDEQEEILRIAKNLDLNVADAVNDDFVTSRIEHIRKQKELDNATPSSSKKAKSTTDDINYWIDKGELPPKDQVELRRKVVNARQKRSKNSKKFNN
jgi:hypothetical protein